MALTGAVTPQARRSYTAVQVTLASANTPYRLLALINTITQAQTPSSLTPGAAREVSLQADPANSGNVLVGDGFLSTTNYGYLLAPGGTRVYRSEVSAVLNGSIYVESSQAGALLNVEIMMG